MTEPPRTDYRNPVTPRATERPPSNRALAEPPAGDDSRADGRGSARSSTPARERRRRLLTRALPLAAAAAAALVAGIVAGAAASTTAAERFLAAWETRDFAAMHAELSSESATRYPLERFATLYEEAERTATQETVVAEGPEESPGGEEAVAALTIDTHAFGTVAADLVLPLAEDRIAWSRELVFPGLAPGERLERRVEVPERAPILAADGTPLAEGDAFERGSPLGDAADDVAGELEVPEGEQAEALAGRGFPPATPTGASGLEEAFDARLAGQPGGELLAAAPGAGEPRTLASAEPVPGEPVPTRVDPELQTAAAGALGGRQGGVAVLDVQDGSVRALAGTAHSAPQPPGSTFKVVTAAAALDAGTVAVADKFPIRVALKIDGHRIENAEPPCGGTLEASFAHSCNSVFAPIGVELGAGPLIDAAERFGFNSPPELYGPTAAPSAGPPASTVPTAIETDRELALTAIGEGQVRATPLQMASVAQAIAAGGTRMPTTLVATELSPEAVPTAAASRETAETIEEFMELVVAEGTAAEAGLPLGQVAGKTGTAELRQAPLRAAGVSVVPSVDKPLNAWFVAFAPVEDPQLAVAVLILDSGGAGGDVAAPVARNVLAAGVQ